jgi:hypothetical protein
MNTALTTDRAKPGSKPVAHRRMGVVLLASIGCAALVIGCSSKKSDAGARLEGVVTLDGNPITEGNLQFIPPQSNKQGPVVVSIKDGRYVAPAVPLGKIRVLVGATKKTGRMIKEYSTPYPEVVSIIPERYRDGIEINVTGDNPNQNIELKSR